MILRRPLFKQHLSRQHLQTRPARACRCAALLAGWLAVIGASAARAESLKAQISVLSAQPARVRIEGERSVAARAWSFRNVYAGVTNLGERLENLTLFDSNGAPVEVKKLAPGEYEAAAAATRFVYEMRLEAPPFESDAAHVSWLTGERGFLMTGDLLPLVASGSNGERRGASLRFVLPPGWTVSADAKAEGGLFEVTDQSAAVFFVGQNLREKRQRVGSMDFSFVTAGEWAFTDEDLASMAADILKDHAGTFGGAAQASAVLMLSPFPRPAGANRWSAETRGRTVLLLAGKSPSKTAALAQLGYPLAHELFHLWTPNGLVLDGDYDWFYEGFTLYQALRASVRLNLLSFQDYLNALSRAFDAYKSSSQGGPEVSLLDTSRRRWTSAPAQVYDRGMLVAFLYDLSLRQKTKGRRSLDDVYKELFRLYRAGQVRKDGNSAVLEVLNGAGDMREFTRQYVEGTGAIDLAAALSPFGLRVESWGARTRVRVADTLSGAQRDLLRKFGYNDKLDAGHGRR